VADAPATATAHSTRGRRGAPGQRPRPGRVAIVDEEACQGAPPRWPVGSGSLRACVSGDTRIYLRVPYRRYLTSERTSAVACQGSGRLCRTTPPGGCPPGPDAGVHRWLLPHTAMPVTLATRQEDRHLWGVHVPEESKQHARKQAPGNPGSGVEDVLLRTCSRAAQGILQERALTSCVRPHALRVSQNERRSESTPGGSDVTRGFQSAGRRAAALGIRVRRATGRTRAGVHSVAGIALASVHRMARECPWSRSYVLQHEARQCAPRHWGGRAPLSMVAESSTAYGRA
jgi:hypothetical protein